MVVCWAGCSLGLLLLSVYCRRRPNRANPTHLYTIVQGKKRQLTWLIRCRASHHTNTPAFRHAPAVHPQPWPEVASFVSQSACSSSPVGSIQAFACREMPVPPVSITPPPPRLRIPHAHAPSRRDPYLTIPAPPLVCSPKSVVLRASGADILRRPTNSGPSEVVGGKSFCTRGFRAGESLGLLGNGLETAHTRI